MTHTCIVVIVLDAISYGIRLDQLNSIYMALGNDGVQWPQFVQQMQQQQNQFMQQMMQQLNSGLHPQVIPQEATSGSFLDFFRMNPPEFQGGSDLVKAHEWLSCIERVFSIVHYSEKNKVIFASHMMNGPIVRWW